MKYQSEILKSFEILKFTPRDGQVEAINILITHFLDDGFKTVVLSAPTGVGKSIIAAVTAETLHRITNPSKENGASFSGSLPSHAEKRGTLRLHSAGWGPFRQQQGP